MQTHFQKFIFSTREEKIDRNGSTEEIALRDVEMRTGVGTAVNVNEVEMNQGKAECKLQE